MSFSKISLNKIPTLHTSNYKLGIFLILLLVVVFKDYLIEPDFKYHCHQHKINAEIKSIITEKKRPLRDKMVVACKNG